jgi:CBS domain-containing protein
LNSRLVTDETVSIRSTENVFRVLDRMVQKKVHALAVVDEMEDEKIIGNFSATDLLNVKHGHITLFFDLQRRNSSISLRNCKGILRHMRKCFH